MLSAREWEPGDIATVSNPVHGRLTMIYCGNEDCGCWHRAETDGAMRCLSHGQALEIVPLVAIDPDCSNTALEPIWQALSKGRALESRANLRAALRSLIAPPKPPEPTGLGAVVEDALGVPWVKVPGDMGTAATWVCEHSAEASWDDVEAVKVLSEGVTP